MGTTSKPLHILCIGLWGEEFVALQAQGHTVHRAGVAMEDRYRLTEHELTSYDLIVGPTCWRLRPDLLKYLPLALKEARRGKILPGRKRPTRSTQGDSHV